MKVILSRARKSRNYKNTQFLNIAITIYLSYVSSKARYILQTKPIHSCHCYSNTKYVFTILADFAFGLSKKSMIYRNNLLFIFKELKLAKYSSLRPISKRDVDRKNKIITSIYIILSL